MNLWVQKSAFTAVLWRLLMSNKNHSAHLRKQLITQRDQLSTRYKQLAAKQIADQLTATIHFQQSNHIACYLANRGEVDTTAIIQKIWAENKNCYLPVLNSDQEDSLLFLPYHPNDQLIANRFGILEPINRNSNIIQPQNLDLAIVPLVGFNHNNYRLGHGQGYYDKTFAFKLKKIESKPTLIGLAYHFQAIAFEPKSWDVPLQMVIVSSALR